jgi:hypothetical protein
MQLHILLLELHQPRQGRKHTLKRHAATQATFIDLRHGPRQLTITIRSDRLFGVHRDASPNRGCRKRFLRVSNCLFFRSAGNHASRGFLSGARAFGKRLSHRQHVIVSRPPRRNDATSHQPNDCACTQEHKELNAKPIPSCRKRCVSQANKDRKQIDREQ